MFKVIPLHSFLRDFKFLHKAYRSLKPDVDELVLILKENPSMGTPFGSDCYKIRMAIASKGRGKVGAQGLLPA